MTVHPEYFPLTTTDFPRCVLHNSRIMMSPALIMGVVSDLLFCAPALGNQSAVNDPATLVFGSDHNWFLRSMTTAECSVFLRFSRTLNSSFLYSSRACERHSMGGWFIPPRGKEQSILGETDMVGLRNRLG